MVVTRKGVNSFYFSWGSVVSTNTDITIRTQGYILRIDDSTIVIECKSTNTFLTIGYNDRIKLEYLDFQDISVYIDTYPTEIALHFHFYDFALDVTIARTCYGLSTRAITR